MRFRAGQIAILFIALAAIASIPILLYPWPPLSDYINHLARMHVIATIGSDPNLALFYQIEWQVIPNLMMDLIVPILQRVMNVYLAGQAYTIMTFVLILSGTLALNRQLYRHWSVLPLIAFPLLYNNVFLVGTMNYLFGIGLALWALTSWVALRERAVALRLAVSTLFVLALFFCHLFAVGVYGLGLLAFELQRLLALRWRGPLAVDGPAKPGLPPWLDFIVSGLPFLPVLGPCAGISRGSSAAKSTASYSSSRSIPVRQRSSWQRSLQSLPSLPPATGRCNSIPSAGCSWRSAASPIWRCHACSSTRTWRTSACRLRWRS